MRIVWNVVACVPEFRITQLGAAAGGLLVYDSESDPAYIVILSAREDSAALAAAERDGRLVRASVTDHLARA